MSAIHPAELGSYKILGTLGQGGMGVVYRALDPRLRREVAIKVLPPKTARDPTLRARLLREARAASALRHPHIVTIYGVEEHDGTPMIVMECVDGDTLEARLREGPLDPEVVREILLQVLDALEAAHAEGVLHRDLKPSNLIVESGGRVRILDFGLATWVDGLGPTRGDPVEPNEASVRTAEGVVLGTPAYMSPEQAGGELVGVCSDLFSLGVLAHEALTGRRLFGRTSQAATLAAVLRDPAPPLPPTVPLDLAGTVERMLQKAPGDRPSSAKEAAAMLSTAADGSLATEVTGGALRIGSSTWPTLAVGLAGLGLVGLVASWFLATDGMPQASEWKSPSVRTLTSDPGWEWAPSLNYDGSLVAFVRFSDEDAVAGRFYGNVFVRSVESGSEIQVTEPPAGSGDRSPRWSPDGQWVQFQRVSTDGGPPQLLRVPALGGAEEMLWEGHSLGSPTGTPDGEALLVERDSALWVVPIDGSDDRQVTWPPEGYRDQGGDFSSPHTLGFWRAGGDGWGLYCEAEWPTNRGDEPSCWSLPPRPPQANALGFGMVHGTGRLLAYYPGIRDPWRLWTPTSSRVVEEPFAGFGTSVLWAAGSRDGRRMVLVEGALPTLALWEVVGDRPPKILAASTKSDSAPLFSPDGSRILFRSNRQGPPRWFVLGEGGDLTGPLWSPDGATVSRQACWRPEGTEVVTVGHVPSADDQATLLLSRVPVTRGPHKVLHAFDGLAGWIAPVACGVDHAFIAGAGVVWRVGYEGGAAAEHTASPGSSHPVIAASEDGKWLYDARGESPDGPRTTVYRTSTMGGPSERLAELPQAVWEIHPDGDRLELTVSEGGPPFGALEDWLLDVATGALTVGSPVPRGLNGRRATTHAGRAVVARFDSGRAGADLVLVDAAPGHRVVPPAP